MAKTLGEAVLSNSTEEAGFHARLYAPNRTPKLCRSEGSDASAAAFRVT